MNQVHIVGISPRSGTTLMAELMLHCFDFDAWADHELPVYYAPHVGVRTLCTKKPSDLTVALRSLKARKKVWIICMIRDPRDIVVSRHSKHPDKYYANLGIVLSRMKHYREALEHDRFAVVKYEDLVSAPDEIQKRLKSKLVFLTPTADFSDFHTIAQPTKSSVAALSGVRPISTASIGRWKQHLPRVRSQVDQYPEISTVLRELGYEQNDDWLDPLQSVVPNDERGHFEGRDVKPLVALRRKLLVDWLLTRQRIGLPKKATVLLKKNGRQS